MRVDIDDGKNILEGQGHKVKGQGQIGDLLNICLAYKSYSIDWIDTKMKTHV